MRKLNASALILAALTAGVELPSLQGLYSKPRGDLGKPKSDERLAKAIAKRERRTKRNSK